MTSTRRGRPPHPDVLTPAEWRVAEGVREGRTYAEIADELGVSVNTVRYHVSNIFTKLGFSSRQELERWEGRPRRRREWAMAFAALGWRGAAAGVVGVAFVVVVVLTFAMLLGDGGSAEEQPAALAFEDMAEYATFTADELSTLGFIDTGPVFRSEDGSAFESMVRAGFTGVRVPSGSIEVLRDVPWVQGWTSPRMESYDQSRFGARTGDHRPALHIVASLMRDGHGITSTSTCRAFVSGSMGGVDVEWRDVDAEQAIDGLDGSEVMLGACDEAGGARLSAVDVDGRLWVHARPIAAQMIAWPAGEALDLSAMEEVGRWHRAGEPVSYSTSCNPPERCRVGSNASSAATAPFGGEIACETAPEGYDRLLLRGERWGIELQPHLGTVEFWCPGTLASAGWQPISEGDRLPTRSGTWVWRITRAWDADGDPVDAAITEDGRLFLGDAGARLGCPPCIAGN